MIPEFIGIIGQSIGIGLYIADRDNELTVLTIPLLFISLFFNVVGVIN